MSRYWFFISNRSTRQCIDVVAETAEAACGQVGWELTECVVITVGEMRIAESRIIHGCAPAAFPSLQRTLPQPRR
jgi:hypothetical protein